MLQSFPTKAKSAQRSGKKLVEYQFYGLDTTENWNSQQSKGSGRQWTKNMLLLLNFIDMQALSQDVQLSSLMLDGFFCEFGVWRTEGDLELERSTNGCQGLRWSASDPVFFYISQSLSRQCNDRTEILPNFLLPSCEKVLYIFVSVSITRQTSDGTHKNCVATDARHDSEWAQLVKAGTG